MFLLILRYHQSFSKKKSPELVGLVGGLEHGFYDFPFSWEWKIIPTDFHSIIFQRGRSTTNQWCYPIIIPLLSHYYSIIIPLLFHYYPIIIPLLSILNHIKTIYPGIIPALKKPPHRPHTSTQLRRGDGMSPSEVKDFVDRYMPAYIAYRLGPQVMGCHPSH